MLKTDLLFIQTDEQRTTEDILQDLCFENIQLAVFEENQELYDIFADIIRKPLRDIESILERQNILKDFLEHPHLAQDIWELCSSADKYKIKIKKAIYKTIPPADRLKEYYRVTNEALELPKKLYALLRGREFVSCTLKQLAAMVADTEKFSHFKEKLGELGSFIYSGDVTMHIHYATGFKVRAAEIISTVKQWDTSGQSKRFPFFQNKKSTPNDREIDYGENFIFKNIMDDIHNAAVISVCTMVSQINTAILSFFNKLGYEVSYYRAALKLVRYMKCNQLSYCFPKLSEDKKIGIEARGLYDISFECFLRKNKMETSIVANDISCKQGKILIVTGPNQGGKTTFLRSVGISQLLAQAGLVVPAESYRCNIMNGIITHFPKEEDMDMNNGKLAEELTRLRRDILHVREGGLVLLNESFATTTAYEGAQIAKDVIRALSRTGSVVIFVTHLYEFALTLDALNPMLYNGQKTVSLVAGFEEKTDMGKVKRTYRITPGKPHKEVFASDLFNI